VLNADRNITDYRVTQTAPNAVLIELGQSQDMCMEAAKAGLEALFAGAGVSPKISLATADLGCTGYAKRRRVLVARDTFS